MHTRILTVLLLLAMPLAAVAQAQSFKVVGYLPHWKMHLVESVEFERLTHVNIAFANPEANGDLTFEGVNVAPAVTRAHAHGCKVFVSLGGGAIRPAWEVAWDNLALPDNRHAFIQNIVRFVRLNGFDGVDMDLEWNYVKDWYSPFVLELKAALNAENLPLTAALPGSHRYPQITSEALAAFDWVNMMSYDLTGPWDASNPGQHSPYDWSEECITYWKTQNVPADRLTLGVPFYGYDFGTSPPSSFTYADVVSQDPANAQRDESAQKYWNGIPTIRAKTQLALREASGIMIWDVCQDAQGAWAEYSLLRTIAEVAAATDVADTRTARSHMTIVPNVVRDVLQLVIAGPSPYSITISDLQGRTLYTRQAISESSLLVSTQDFAPGMYVVTLVHGHSAAVASSTFVRM